jgi:hypothetical protein
MCGKVDRSFEKNCETTISSTRNNHKEKYIMKKTLVKFLFLTTAALALVGTSAKAAPVIFNNGDLILGFRATGGTGSAINLQINLGAGTFYRDQNNSFFNIGNFNTDLEAAYGVGWSSRSDISFGIVGVFDKNLGPSGVGTVTNGDGQRTIYASNGTAGYSMGSTGNMGSIATDIFSLNGAFDTAEDAATTVSALVDTASINSWSTFVPGGGSGPFSGAGNSFESSFSGGAGSLELYRYIPRTSGAITEPQTPLIGVSQGTFNIASNGQLTYGIAVPEPSTYALMGLGLLALVGLHRHKKNSEKALKA